MACGKSLVLSGILLFSDENQIFIKKFVLVMHFTHL
jgi:hypothetical protein